MYMQETVDWKRMESELLKYRRKKIADERSAKMKESIQNAWDKVTGRISAAVLPDSDEVRDVEEAKDQTELLSPGMSSSTSEENLSEEEESPEEHSKKYKMMMLFLKFLMWLFAYIGFVKIGFGAVYFCVTALWFIYASTSTRRKKKKGEKSAYSVFNENCEAIDGTLKAEQLERQLLFGGLAGH
ncbi:unnamed protein product [Allacma fusca]|uniref:SAYSvFN domain-containing protein n=1 Tax=Allacma fusca TaxID=39272 RepID=A0A8J2KWD9_9HEXA|nr:unnamed protein product [Allacma fusca]